MVLSYTLAICSEVGVRVRAWPAPSLELRPVPNLAIVVAVLLAHNTDRACQVGSLLPTSRNDVAVLVQAEVMHNASPVGRYSHG